MKRDRPAEINFYEWHMATWSLSETRDRLDACGRGIYRELIDQCYGQGGFPDDPEWICRKCACTMEEYKKWWPVIQKKFPKSSTKRGYRYLVRAEIVRREYAKYVEGQRERRKHQIINRFKNIDIDEVAQVPADSRNDFSDSRNGLTATATATATATNKEEPPIPPSGEGGGISDPKPITVVDDPKPEVSKRKKREATPKTIAEAEKLLGSERLPWFAEFWKIFPVQEGKLAAMIAYERKVKTIERARDVWKAAAVYAQKIAAERKAATNPREVKVKWPQGWLNEERWEDVLYIPDREDPTVTMGGWERLG